MSKEKQIEEMARACCWGGARDGKSCEDCLNDSILKLKDNECEWKTRVAKALFDAGYRKQSDNVTDINVGNKADVVEVVRCRDCTVPHNFWTGCPRLKGLIPPPNFYCAYGERKTDENRH